MNYLNGERIKLVLFDSSYITDEYIGWLNDPEVNRFLMIGRVPVSKDQIKNPNCNDYILFAIKIKKLSGNDVFGGNYLYIGTASLNKIDYITRKAECGIMIGNKEFWKQGIATEVISIICDYAFNRLNLHKIESGVVEGNTGSMKAFKKNGFIEYGINPDDYFVDGKYLATKRFYKINK